MLPWLFLEPALPAVEPPLMLWGSPGLERLVPRLSHTTATVLA